MRKLLFLGVIIACLFLAVAYLHKPPEASKAANHSGQAISKTPDTPEQTPEQISSQVPKQNEEVQKNPPQKRQVDSPYFQSAKEGKVDGIEFAIGDKIDKVLAKWGKANTTGAFEGYSYISYDKATFFYDETEVIRQIAFNRNFKTYGITSGMKPEEIKKILGPPSSEGMVEQDQAWAIEYFLGKYSVLFFSENEDYPVTSGTLQMVDSTEEGSR